MPFMRNVKTLSASSFLLLVASLSCASGTGVAPTRTLEFDFATDVQGWVAGFADYPSGSESFYELASGFRNLPAPLDGRGGFFLSGNNHSDDLFMYLKRRVSGLEPGAEYNVTLSVEFATDAPASCGGVGGAPGESVCAKAGASGVEPMGVDQSGVLRMNIDKGNQGTSGKDAIVIGDVTSSTACDQGTPQYELKRLKTPRAVRVRADGAGTAWLLIGTDSGYEAVTTLYYTRVTAEISRA